MNLYLLYVRIEWQKCVSFFDLTYTFPTMCQVNRCTISSSQFFFLSKMVFRWMRSEKQQSKKNEQKESVFRKVTSYLLFFGSVSFILLVYSFRLVGWRYYDILHYQHCIFLSLMRWWTFEQTRTLGKSIAFKSHALLHALSFYFLFKSNFLFNTI